MIIKVYSQLSPSAVLLLTDPQSTTQQISAIANQMASATISSITKRAQSLGDPEGLEAQKLRREATKEFENLPSEINDATIEFLRLQSPHLLVSTSFLNSTELLVSVDTLPSAASAVPSVGIH